MYEKFQASMLIYTPFWSRSQLDLMYFVIRKMDAHLQTYELCQVGI
jgi:hypothetical protein